MGLVDRVNAATAETRAIGGVPWQPWADPRVRFDVGGPIHPSRVAAHSGIEAALRLQPVYSSVRILAEGVAQLPLRQYRELGERKVKMPLGQFLQKPSAFLNRFDWLYQYITSAALTGTAWGLITARDGYGYPTSVEWLPPEQMVVEDSSPYNPAKARFYYAGRPLQRDDLLIIRAFTVAGHTAGVSPLRHFQMLIESGIDALAYGADWYKAGGFPPGTFQNSQYEVDDTQSDAIRRKLVRAMRNREPLVYGRDWEYKPIAVPPDEAQFINAMQLNATQIASIFSVPPWRVGGTRGDSMTYANVESEALEFVVDGLDPWLTRFEAAMADVLPAQQYASFDRNARLRMTPETRWTVYRAMRDIGGMNVNEIRALEDLPPIPKPTDADDFDGSDWTPLQIQVAAARGIKELVGEGTGNEVETNPSATKTAPGAPSSPPPATAPAPPGQSKTVPLRPQPVPATNGSKNGANPRKPAR